MSGNQNPWVLGPVRAQHTYDAQHMAECAACQTARSRITASLNRAQRSRDARLRQQREDSGPPNPQALTEPSNFQQWVEQNSSGSGQPPITEQEALHTEILGYNELLITRLEELTRAGSDRRIAEAMQRLQDFEDEVTQMWNLEMLYVGRSHGTFFLDWLRYQRNRHQLYTNIKGTTYIATHQKWNSIIDHFQLYLASWDGIHIDRFIALREALALDDRRQLYSQPRTSTPIPDYDPQSFPYGDTQPYDVASAADPYAGDENVDDRESYFDREGVPNIPVVVLPFFGYIQLANQNLVGLQAAHNFRANTPADTPAPFPDMPSQEEMLEVIDLTLQRQTEDAARYTQLHTISPAPYRFDEVERLQRQQLRLSQWLNEYNQLMNFHDQCMQEDLMPQPGETAEERRRRLMLRRTNMKALEACFLTLHDMVFGWIDNMRAREQREEFTNIPANTSVSDPDSDDEHRFYSDKDGGDDSDDDEDGNEEGDEESDEEMADNV